MTRVRGNSAGPNEKSCISLHVRSCCVEALPDNHFLPCGCVPIGQHPQEKGEKGERAIRGFGWDEPVRRLRGRPLVQHSGGNSAADGCPCGDSPSRCEDFGQNTYHLISELVKLPSAVKIVQEL